MHGKTRNPDQSCADAVVAVQVLTDRDVSGGVTMPRIDAAGPQLAAQGRAVGTQNPELQ